MKENFLNKCNAKKQSEQDKNMAEDFNNIQIIRHCQLSSHR